MLDRLLDDRYTFGLKQGHERDEREANQRSGVIGHDTLSQGDAQCFNARAARAIVGPLQSKIAFDLFVVYIAERYRGRNARELYRPRRSVVEAQCGMKRNGPPTHGTQLPHGGGMAARLSEVHSGKLGHLVRSDDERWWGCSHGSRLCFRQTQSGLLSRFLSKRRFIDIRGDDREWEPESLQQLTPIAGAGGENEIRGSHIWLRIARRGLGEAV